MIKTLIIEDELYIRKGLIALINTLNKGLSIIGECETVKEAVTVVKACKPDLVFLDINLPDGNAFEFLEQTKQLHFKVVFITAYQEYALQALKNGAVDYILKPVDIEELEIAIDKVLKTNSFIKREQLTEVKKVWNTDNDKLILSLRDTFQVVLLKELMYCTSNKGYTVFYLNDGHSYMTSKPLKEYEDALPEDIFIRTHQSYFVNTNYIDAYDKSGYITLKNGKKIPVSTRKKETFLSRFLNL
jgi:two-component system LytT family response regulator